MLRKMMGSFARRLYVCAMCVVGPGATWWLCFASMREDVYEGALGTLIGVGYGLHVFVRHRLTITRDNLGDRLIELVVAAWFGALAGLAIGALRHGFFTAP